MDRNQLLQLSEFMDTICNDYIYITDDDWSVIDAIDEKIFRIDKKLYSIVTEQKVEKTIESMIEDRIKNIPFLQLFYDVCKGNESHDELLNRRKQLVLERANLIATSKERLERNNPTRYKEISEMANQTKNILRRF